MRIIILGCGLLGSLLADTLAKKHNDVIVIDQDEDSFRRLTNSKIERIAGNILNEEILAKAFLKKTDIFVAVTDRDTINLMIAQVVMQRFKDTRIIARVYDPTLAGAYKELGLETLCPTTLSLEKMEKMFK